ncbi:hypothetical protein D3C75_889830 [compost metagenome]
MEGRYQWRALAAGSHIATAEVGDHADAGQLGEQCGVTDLHSKAAGRFMANGLAVAADGANGFGLQSLASQQLADTFAGQAGPAVFRQCGTGNLVSAAAA